MRGRVTDSDIGMDEQTCRSSEVAGVDAFGIDVGRSRISIASSLMAETSAYFGE
jgi:hypothetical protein